MIGVGLSTSDVKDWAGEARQVGIFLLMGLAVAGTVGGLIFLYLDVRTSYLGWGNNIQHRLNITEGAELLAWTVSLLPTFIQILWFVAKATRLPFGNQKMFTTIAIVCFGADNILDFVQLWKGDAVSVGWVLFLIFVIFSFASEWLISFCAPIAFTLLKHLMEQADLGFDNDGIGRRRPPMRTPPMPRMTGNPMGRSPETVAERRRGARDRE